MHLICPPTFCITSTSLGSLLPVLRRAGRREHWERGWHNLCFLFLLGITVVPREIENNANAKFWGQIRCIVGSVKVAYTQSRYNLGQSCILEEHFSKHRPTTPPPPGSSGVVSKRTPHSLGVCGKQR